MTMAMNQVTLAAQELALIEEKLFYQGEDAPIPGSIKVAKASDLGHGLIGKAIEINEAIPVKAPDAGRPDVYGTATYSAVTKGISVFAANLQGPPFALILDPDTYADAHLPLLDSAIITPASANPTHATRRRASLRLPECLSQRSEIQPPPTSPMTPAMSGRLANIPICARLKPRASIKYFGNHVRKIARL